MTHRRAILKMTASPRTSDGSVNKVYASDNTSISVWDTKHNQLIDKHLIGRHRGAIGALDSIDANHFLSASVEDGCVCLWKYCNPPPI
jgi:WD40 repeat protein